MNLATPPLNAPAFDAAARNPDNPNHLMVIKPVKQRVQVHAGDVLVADSTSALRVMEIGRSVYDPVFYIPASDIVADLTALDKSTHCPIKGDATYRSLNGIEIGWLYEHPIPMASELANHLAFWPDKVRFTIGS